MLFVCLWLLDHFIHALVHSKPVMYMLGMVATGAAFYTALFLFMPLSGLQAEQTTWKRKIGLLPGLQPK
jgi:hypothetical protein